ncbi:hypothetical protein TNCV_5009771 [Trichonephila clavipes]|nr:hypothetical protein TNCV_5009771 [Trichonephila clavipes]
MTAAVQVVIQQSINNHSFRKKAVEELALIKMNQRESMLHNTPFTELAVCKSWSRTLDGQRCALLSDLPRVEGVTCFRVITGQWHNVHPALRRP